MNTCNRCGNRFEGNYCPNCGTKYAPVAQSYGQMGCPNNRILCPKCNSNNVQIQAKKAKNTMLWGCTLTLGGFGLMLFGIIGAIIGLVLGVIIGAIISSLIPTQYETIAVCQNCGNSFKIVKPIVPQQPQPTATTDDKRPTIKDATKNYHSKY